MVEFSKQHDIAVVSGSDLPKLKEQLGNDLMTYFKYVFCENGLVAYKEGKMIGSNSFKQAVGQTNYNHIVNFALLEMSKLELPVKTGTFIELRTGNLNVCPIGRNCKQNERDEFFKLDKEQHIRENLINKFKEEFKEMGLSYSAGGQISIDIFLKGWDKTYCLRYLKECYDSIFYFGDTCYEGGNDYEISISKDIARSHQVSGPQETMQFLKGYSN